MHAVFRGGRPAAGFACKMGGRSRPFSYRSTDCYSAADERAVSAGALSCVPCCAEDSIGTHLPSTISKPFGHSSELEGCSAGAEDDAVSALEDATGASELEAGASEADVAGADDDGST